MAGDILIYGAYGYTGRLVAERAAALGLKPRLAGRDAAKIRGVGEALGCPWVAFDLHDGAAVRAALKDAEVVIHCAGPFALTYQAMLEACLATGTHYLDITGEWSVLEGCAARDGDARAAGIMVMPGVGFDVVPTDCMAARLKAAMRDATHLRLAFCGDGIASRGTMRTAARQLAERPKVRRNGVLIDRLDPPDEALDFGKGMQAVAPVNWGDLVTAWHSTGIANIEVYFVPPRDAAALLKLPQVVKWLLTTWALRPLVQSKINAAPEGPTAEQRARGVSLIYGRVRNSAGAVQEMRLVTMDGYELTSHSAVEIARRVLANEFKVGFQTPSMAYGADLVLSLDRTRWIDA